MFAYMCLLSVLVPMTHANRHLHNRKVLKKTTVPSAEFPDPHTHILYISSTKYYNTKNILMIYHSALSGIFILGPLLTVNFRKPAVDLYCSLFRYDFVPIQTQPGP